MLDIIMHQVVCRREECEPQQYAPFPTLSVCVRVCSKERAGGGLKYGRERQSSPRPIVGVVEDKTREGECLRPTTLMWIAS